MVPAEGNLESAKLIIVGEQPGRNEAREGRPFVGPAGRVLMDVLGSLGISRQDCYITNTIKEFQRPLEYYFDQKNLFTGPGQAQIELLKQELKGTSQPVVLTGNVPLAAIYGFVGITKWRGSILRMPGNNDQFVIPTIHPVTVLPPKCVYTNKLLIQYDLDKARRIFTGEYKPTEWKMEVTNSPSQTYALLDDYYQRGLAGEIVYYDIEIYNGEVSCISFSLQAAEGVCIPFMDSHGDRMSIENEANVWLRIARILEDVTITKAGQNIVFDSHFLLRKYGIKGKNFHDTMIAQRTLMPDYPIGLDFITSIWTDHKYYKDEGKAFFKGSGSWERLFQYNATDSAICSTALPKQLETLHSRNNIPAYDRQRRMIEPLTFMMERGVRADLKGIQQEAVEIDARLITLQEDLNKLAGRPLNPNSPKQLQEYLYGTLGHAPYRKRGPGGGITTDNNAIKRLIRKGVDEASIIQEIRGLRKLRSTYLEVSKFDSDGRLRCSYNPVGTKFSRLSSSENIFDTGMNMQNLNENLLKYLMADKGFVVYRFDLAQAENRIVAYVGNITAMIEAFENGIDLHKLTAALVFGKRIEDISDEKGSSTLGDGKHSERDWGKRCVVAGTEILTPNGWCKIEDWEWDKTEIAQWNPENSCIDFTKATNCSRYLSDVIELSGRHSHIIGTANHKIPLYRSDRYKFYTMELKDIKTTSFNSGIPVTGYFDNKQSILTDAEVQLLVAFQADGTYSYNGHKFGLKKQRKIERLKKILSTLNIEFTESVVKNDMTNICFKGPFWLTKKFDSNLLMLGIDQMITFMRELPHWDGYFSDKKTEYFSTVRGNVEWAQTLAHLCGYTATITKRSPTGYGKKPLYILDYNTKTKYATLVTQTKTSHSGQYLVIGPEVPTGFFLIRSHGVISITGNSNHSLNYDFGYRAFAMLYEMPETQAKFIVDSYHRAYPGVRNTFHAMVKRMLATDRTIVNLLGRKTLFLNEWGDKLFKEAYSCIPQGTVGDIINEYGVEHIYYDLGPYYPIELLTQVHDEVGFQISTSLPWIEHAKLLNNIKSTLEISLEAHNRTFKIPADLSISLTFSKKHKVELKNAKWPTTDEALAKELETIYSGLVEDPANAAYFV